MKRWHISLILFLVLLLALGRIATAQDHPALEIDLSISQAGDDSLQPSPFGIIESTESPSEAGSLGVGWTRLIFHWGELQPDGPDDWQPEFDYEQLDREIAAGREVVGMLIGIPDWARDENKLPAGLWLDYDDPNVGDNTNTWAQYVRETVTYYEDYIDHWLIWNEPDIPKTEIAHSWDGTVADFAQLQRVAYLAAKEANPAAVIHLSAFTYWADYYAGTEQYIDRLLDELLADPDAAANNYYFDIASAHLYFQPDQIYDLLGLFIEAMRSRDLDHPIWLVETNAPPKDDPDWPVPDWTLSVTLREQAAFMPQAVASAFAAGAERISVYKLQDTEDDRAANPEPFGLLRMDGTRRPAFDTYRIAIKQLGGAFNVERDRWDEVGSVRFDQPGQITTVLYSRLPQPQQAEIEATAGTAILMDMFGTRQVITSTNGIYTVDLPAARCSQSIADYCMIGGFTYYLIQVADILPPTPTPGEQSSPQLETPTESAQSVSSPTPTPEITSTSTPLPTEAPTKTPIFTAVSTPTQIAADPTPTIAASPTSPTAFGPTITPGERSSPQLATASPANQPPTTSNQPSTPSPQSPAPSPLLYGLIAPLSIAAIVAIFAIIRRLRR